MNGRLPERTEGQGLVVRRWRRRDVPALQVAVADSLEHLRPWMPWAAAEPQTLPQRRALVRNWNRLWRAGGDVVMGIFEDGQVVGGTGLHRRRGPAALEIGYWVHVAHTGRGVATRTASLLTSLAFTVPGNEAVEIHHDRANHRSAAVPRRLGFTFVGETPDEPHAPGEVGVDCTWRVTGAQWAARRSPSP